MAVSLATALTRSTCRLATALTRSTCRLVVRTNAFLPLRRYAQEPTAAQNDETPLAATNGDTACGLQRKAVPFYGGISESTFPEQTVAILLAPVNDEDVELKPDGMIYLPEIKYRRIMNRAFGPGGWALMPCGDSMHFHDEHDGAQLVTREYALHCLGRFVAQATGEHTFYGKSNLNYGKACESAKSNALMRCCKDLGVASELWDPQFINAWKKKHAEGVWCQSVRTKEKKRLWKKKSSKEPFAYPWKEMDAKGGLTADQHAAVKSHDWAEEQ